MPTKSFARNRSGGHESTAIAQTIDDRSKLIATDDVDDGIIRKSHDPITTAASAGRFVAFAANR